MTYMEATDGEDGEKQCAETSPDVEAHWNYLGCRLIKSDQSLHSNSANNCRVCINYKGRLDKVQNMALKVTLGAMKTTPVYGMEKQPM